VGEAADLIIISQNLFHIAPRKIGQTNVLVTVVGGKVVYQATDQRTSKEGRKALIFGPS